MGVVLVVTLEVFRTIIVIITGTVEGPVMVILRGGAGERGLVGPQESMLLMAAVEGMEFSVFCRALLPLHPRVYPIVPITGAEGEVEVRTMGEQFNTETEDWVVVGAGLLTG